MVDKRLPKVWRKSYEVVLNLFLEGKSIKEISEQLNRHRNTISRIVRMPEFKDRYQELVGSKQEMYVNARELLDSRKNELLQEKIKLALHAEKENVRSEALSWLLERFPEFATKNITALAQNVTYVSDESNEEFFERHDKAMEDLVKMSEALKDGNPFVKGHTKQDNGSKTGKQNGEA